MTQTAGLAKGNFYLYFRDFAALEAELGDALIAELSERLEPATVMLKDTVDGEFTSTDDAADAVLCFAAAVTGPSLMVSHGWFMQ